MLSIVITTYNSDNTCVTHVREAKAAGADEIIVINDGGDPSIKDRLSGVVYARIEQDIAWNYTGARNLGIWLSRGDFVSVEDVDNIPTKYAYKDALHYFSRHPEVGRVLYGPRHDLPVEHVNLPANKWVFTGRRGRHTDTAMFRRDALLQLKGFNELMAGRYGWSRTETSRRFNAIGIKTECITAPFISVRGGGTDLCKCANDGIDGFCPTCKKLIWRKSGINYNLANDATKGRIKQSAHGILNFTYQYEQL